MLDDPNDEDRLVVSLDGFEGPLDLLLSLARTQKVDLAKISILQLVEQYLEYIAKARELRLEIAADYLLAAAWLAYLKSKMLLPKEEEKVEGPTGEEMALQLAFRLKRLDAMRDAIAKIFGRKQLGVDFFSRGMPEGVRTLRKSEYWASVYDLLKSYAEQRGKTAEKTVKWGGREVWSVREARDRLESMFGQTVNWSILENYLEDYLDDTEVRKTAIASSFGATLELSREGFIEIRQAQPFAPLYLRWLKPKPDDGTSGDPTIPR
ncbi:MAG: segregation/condensation protein A [Hyphomicrobiales bacterium]|nr:segregation/condensation protein A [Hyphomicrobiales bacterium]